MKKFTPEEKAQIKYYRAKMRAIGCIAAAGLIEPQEEIAKHHIAMADKLTALITAKIPKKDRWVIESRIERFALKVSRVRI